MVQIIQVSAKSHKRAPPGKRLRDDASQRNARADHRPPANRRV